MSRVELIDFIENFLIKLWKNIITLITVNNFEKLYKRNLVKEMR